MLKLRPYQQIGIKFLRQKKRAMLTDAPGLGKTVQAAMAATTPVLIACPTYLTEQWAEFLREQFPEAKIALAVGTRPERERALAHIADWYIVNVEMLASHKRGGELFSYTFPKVNTFIIDESHHVRGRQAKQAISALAISKKTPNVFLLTATPIVKEVDDLFMQLKMLDSTTFSSFYKYVDAFCKTISSQWGLRVVGAKDHAVLRSLLSKYALGRSYKEVGLQLPDMIEKIIKVRASDKFYKVYNTLIDTYRKDDKVYDAAIQVLLELRRMTLCKEKLDALVSTIEDNPNGGVVVFCWFRQTAEAMATLLNCPYIHGEMPAAERARVAKSNTTITATLASLSEGIDLSHLRTVIFMEEDYTPGVIYQALSRVRRWSHNNDPVKVYYMMLKSTVDETVHNCVQRRQFDARKILRDTLS